MRRWLLLDVVVVALVVGAATAAPLKADTGKRVVFLSPELAAVSAKFHPRPDRNRVFYAGSLRQARGWAKFTSIPYNLCPDNCEFDFRKYGVLVIFYKGQAARYDGGFDPRIDYIEESAAGELSAKVTAACYAPSCKEAQPDPSDQWGMYILVRIVKKSLLVPPKMVRVTTASA
ncbi:MAG TPA: hypothetical protein VF063_09515 [Gaiellaceae bacterium]